MSYMNYRDAPPLWFVSFADMNHYNESVRHLRSIGDGLSRPARAGFAENAWERA